MFALIGQLDAAFQMIAILAHALRVERLVNVGTLSDPFCFLSCSIFSFLSWFSQHIALASW
jgi:hypothetical protein